MRPHLGRVGAWLAALSLLGCQVISASIQSPFDSLSGTGRAIGGSFEGILNSSGSRPSNGAALQGYVRDLRQYSALFMQRGAGSTEDFQRGITRIAESHGIAHWQAEPATPYAIGQGLREANLSESAMQEFCEQLGAGTPAAKLALQGWQEAGG